ncbi:Fe2+-dependent dioxygenase [Maricaulis sp. CAU 1757]
MPLILADLLETGQTDQLRRIAQRAEFSDGRSTAGRAAAAVKHNTQMGKGPAIDTARSLVRRALMAHPLFLAYAQPRSLTRMLISRYEAGMSYGTHVDDALMGGRRADLSFTVFLSDPESYDGGALVLDRVGGETEVRLEAGQAVVYPTSDLHRVEPVTRGERLAVVGWVRSLVRRPDQREILFDLERASRDVFDRDGKSEVFDLLLKSKTNLLRQWAED